MTFVDEYLTLEGERLQHRLVVERSISHASLSVPIPTLLVQLLVENAIVHGVSRRREPSVLAITASRTGTELVVEVSNPLPAMDSRPRHVGHGTENIRMRLELLYGEAAEFASGEEGKRFVARVSVPAEGPTP